MTKERIVENPRELRRQDEGRRVVREVMTRCLGEEDTELFLFLQATAKPGWSDANV